jgi:competence protein ComEC
MQSPLAPLLEEGAPGARLLRDPLCLGAAALLVGGLAPLAPWATLSGLLACLVLLRGRARRGTWLFIACVFGFGAVRAQGAYEDFETARFAAQRFMGGARRCAFEARVVASPVMRDGKLTFVAEARDIDCEGRRAQGPALVRVTAGNMALGRGDELHVVAEMAPLRLFRNVGLSDPVPGARRSGALLSGSALAVSRLEPGRGLFAAIDAARAHARSRIERTYAPLAQPLGRALVLGENDLDARDGEAFRQSGLMHLLAVSGTHLVFAVVLLVKALTAILVRIERLAARFDVARLGACAGVLLSVAYADFSGGSGSAWRAAWMLSASFLARALGGRLSGVRALGVSLLVGALVDPFAAADLSFALSAAATWGLMALGQPLAKRVEALLGESEERPPSLARKALGYVALGSVATLSSTVPCAPLLALMDDRLTLAGLVANLVAGPFGELAALPACLLHAAASGLPAIEQGLALVGSGALLCVRFVALKSAAATFASFPVPLPSAFQFAVLVVTAVAVGRTALGWGEGLARFGPRLCVLGLGLAALVGLELRAQRVSEGPLRVTMLDIEQGDSTLLELPSGELALVDGGGFVTDQPNPGERVILPLLREMRRSRLRLVVLSHAHPDHLLGLIPVLRETRVDELWHPAGAAATTGAYAELLRLARAQGTRILGPDELCDRPRMLGGVRIEVLGPCPVAPGVGLNDNSLVMRVVHHERSLLLTGDAEADEERRLLTRPELLRADVLKVGHHGSHTSTTEPFLAAVQPRYATISSGVRNRFDHPRQVTLDTLARHGVMTLTTKRSGSLTFESDGNELSWSVFSLPR